MTRWRALVAALIIAALAPTACSREGGDDGQVPVTVGVAATASSTALRLGVEQGYFAEEGLDVELANAATGAAGITQLINGQQQVALGGISPVITAAAQNIPVRIVSGSFTDTTTPAGPINQTIVRGDSPIRSFADLDGRTVGVNSLRCCWEFWMREAVERAGVDANSLRLVQMPFPDQVTALRQGSVDAISTTQPYATQLRQQGFRDIGNSAAIAFDNPNSANTVYYMARSFIEQYPGVVERWRRALQRSSDYANSHPDEARASIVRETRANPDLIAASPLAPYTAALDRGTIEREASFAVKYGVIPQAPPYEELVAP